MEGIINYGIPNGLYFGVIYRRNWSYYNQKDSFSSRKKIDNLEFLFSTGFQYEGDNTLCYCRGEVNEEDYTDFEQKVRRKTPPLRTKWTCGSGT